MDGMYHVIWKRYITKICYITYTSFNILINRYNYMLYNIYAI